MTGGASCAVLIRILADDVVRLNAGKLDWLCELLAMRLRLER